MVARTKRINICVDLLLHKKMRQVKIEKGIAISQQLSIAWKRGNHSGLWGFPKK